MMSFKPEPLEAMRARLPEAISMVYDVDEIADKQGQRPGEQRRHVFDFEDGIRCIISLDCSKSSGEKPYLHMSFSSSRLTMTLGAFFRRIEQIPAELWPDTLLLPMKRFKTERAVHIAFEPPMEWLKAFTGRTA